jgi:phosphoribosyl-ATP pyrophosphohydrolase
MKIRRFYLGKLVRDRIDQLFAQSGATCVTSRELSDAEFGDALRAKVREEATEVCEATNDDELVNECADVLEVLMALVKLHGRSWDEVSAAVAKKATERGQYKRRLFIELVELPDGSEAATYCSTDSQKYPEEPVDGVSVSD